MRSKSHFQKKDCVLGLILKVRVFELASGLLKHFKDQPFPSCCLITQRCLNQHQLPKSSGRHRSHGHQHHQGSFVTLQRALTSLKVGVWSILIFALRSPCKRASALRVHSLWLSYYSKGYSAPLRAVRARVEWNSSFIDRYWVCRAIWYFKTQTDLMSLQCMRVYYDNKYHLHKSKSRLITWSCLMRFCVMSNTFLHIDCFMISDISRHLDKAVNPCDDFYSYTCGGFFKSHELGEEQSMETAFSILNDDNMRVIRQTLQNGTSIYPQVWKTESFF